LATGNGHRIEDVRLNTEQAEFKDLEDAYGAGAHNQGVRFNNFI